MSHAKRIVSLEFVSSHSRLESVIFVQGFFFFPLRAVKERFTRAYFNARYRLEVRRPTEARTCPPSRETCELTSYTGLPLGITNFLLR